METHRTKIAQSGRMIVPAKARKAMGLEEGDDVVLVVKDNGEAVIAGVRESIARAQRIAQKYKREHGRNPESGPI